MALELAHKSDFSAPDHLLPFRKGNYNIVSRGRTYYKKNIAIKMIKNLAVLCDKRIKSLFKDFVIFPFIALTLGIATILAVLFIFPVWLLKETNLQKR